MSPAPAITLRPESEAIFELRYPPTLVESDCNSLKPAELVPVARPQVLVGEKFKLDGFGHDALLCSEGTLDGSREGHIIPVSKSYPARPPQV